MAYSAAGRGRDVVKLSSQPAEQRQDDEAGHGDAPRLPGHFPIPPQPVQHREDQGIDVQAELVHHRPRVAALEGLADADVIDGVRPDNVPAGGRPTLHRQAEERQTGQEEAARGKTTAPTGSRR